MSEQDSVRLSDISEQGQYGLNAAAMKEGLGVRFIRITDIDEQCALRSDGAAYVPTSTERLDAYFLEQGDLLVARSGATAGKSLLYKGLDEPAVFAGYLIRFKLDKTRVLPDFVAYYFKSSAYWEYINTTKRAAAQPNINAKELGSMPIPLPSLEEQRRIVDLLSRAEGIVRLRREAERKAAELIPGIFLDMFGDPATNPKGWPMALFGEVGILDRGRSRHRPRNAKELYGGPYPFIQTGEVANSGGRINGHTTTYSEAGLAQSKIWQKGTLCITIAANIAKTGVLEFDACFPDSVVGFLPSDRVRIAYVQAWLGFLQPTLEANAPQAAQKNINLEILRSLPVPVPPLTLQETFEQRCSDVVSIQSQQAAANAKAQVTFDALLAQTFSGNA